MSNNIYEKFNNMFDVEGLSADIEKAGSDDFEEVPYGDYEVKLVARKDKKLDKVIDGIFLGETSEKSKTPNMPIAKVCFEIVTGEHKGEKIFMNQMVHNGFGLKAMNTFLNSLQTGIEVKFRDYVQYAELFHQIFDAIDGKAEYQLAYGQNDKGFNTYNIVQRFDK